MADTPDYPRPDSPGKVEVFMNRLVQFAGAVQEVGGIFMAYQGVKDMIDPQPSAHGWMMDGRMTVITLDKSQAKTMGALKILGGFGLTVLGSATGQTAKNAREAWETWVQDTQEPASGPALG